MASPDQQLITYSKGATVLSTPPPGAVAPTGPPVIT